ncbi:hypothetical protein LUZ60_015914 [Juncus effusus]|nr:hypothetical protein LUZ60_015914 [Juncus effusus]
MAGENEEAQPVPATPTGTITWMSKIEEQFYKTKEHAETYPYMWGSYILVYGGLGAYLTWRWTKLRRTESRVRVLQERLKKLVEADEAKKKLNGEKLDKINEQ